MNDDNSILESSEGEQISSNVVTDYLESLMTSIHQALDPSAIITPRAVREFGEQGEQESPASLYETRMTSLQQTPRRDPPQARMNPFLTKKPKFQFTKQARSSTEKSTFMDVTTFRPQERTASTPAAASSTNGEYYEHEEQIDIETDEDERPDILLNTSSLTMEMMDDEHRAETTEEFDLAADEEARAPAAAKHKEEEEMLYDGRLNSRMNPYDNLLLLATKNTLMMEKMRDEINQLRVQNAMLLNDMNMIGYDSYSMDGAEMDA
jgi:hypothetical protein